MSRIIVSKDGTRIAYDRQGQGPPVILIDGALVWRSMPGNSTIGTAKFLASDFTVISFDRRGRGESTDTQPYSVDREIEDIEALIDELGGSASVFGASSGGCLALEATIKLGNKIRKLAMYEPPYNSGKDAQRSWFEYRKQLTNLLATGHRGNAVALFMQFVGTPADQIDEIRRAPIWSMFEAVAPTLAYDAAIMGEDRSVPTKKATRVIVPTLVMNGDVAQGLTSKFMEDTAIALVKAIPNAQHLTLKGQTHAASPEALASALGTFFKDQLDQMS